MKKILIMVLGCCLISIRLLAGEPVSASFTELSVALDLKEPYGSSQFHVRARQIDGVYRINEMVLTTKSGRIAVPKKAFDNLLDPSPPVVLEGSLKGELLIVTHGSYPPDSMDTPLTIKIQDGKVISRSVLGQEEKLGS